MKYHSSKTVFPQNSQCTSTQLSMAQHVFSVDVRPMREIALRIHPVPSLDGNSGGIPDLAVLFQIYHFQTSLQDFFLCVHGPHEHLMHLLIVHSARGAAPTTSNSNNSTRMIDSLPGYLPFT